MKKLFIIIIILVLLILTGIAQQVDNSEYDKYIEELREKYYGSGIFFQDVTNDWAFVYEYWSMTFEDGKLFVETQDGKWFVEMKEIKEGDEL